VYLLAALLALPVGLCLGLLGGGGSTLTTPILVYALGVEPRQAIATSLLVVGVTSAVAAVQHARAGNVAWRTGFLFGGAGMIGAFLGGLASVWVPANVLLALFACLMGATSIAMFRGRREVRAGPPRPRWKTLRDGVLVGAGAGLVGAGGGFLVVPALALAGGLPMRKAIGTSLFVITLQCLAGFVGHASHTPLDMPLAGVVTGAAIAGALLGAVLARRVPAEGLRKGFAAFVLAMAGFVLYQTA
jgi:uncharacterized membrane protein YfcA